MKILINRTYDNFTMSQKAISRYNELAGTDYRRFDYIGENILEEFERGKEFEKEYNETLECKYPTVANIVIIGDNLNGEWVDLDKDIPRNDKYLLQVFEELGDEFLEQERFENRLEIVEIPNNVNFKIISSDEGGSEYVKYFTYKLNTNALQKIIDKKKSKHEDMVDAIANFIEEYPKLIQTKEIYV